MDKIRLCGVQRAVSLVTIASMGFAQSACSTLQAQARVDPQTIAYYNPGRTNAPVKGGTTALAGNYPDCPAKLDGDSNSGAINLDCFRFPENRGTGKTAYERVADEKTDAMLRNRLAAILIKQSDDICEREMGNLTANEAIANTALTTLDSFFSTAATIVSGKQAKSILSGLAGASNTGRTTLRAEVYRNVLTTAISHAIINKRTTVKTALEAKYTLGPGQYTVDQMIVDVNGYHQICSFYRGISLVSEAVEAAKPPANPAADASATAIAALDKEIAKTEDERAKAVTAGENTAQLDKSLADLRTSRTALAITRAQQLSTVQK